MIKQWLLFFLALFLALCSKAQKFQGVWEGKLLLSSSIVKTMSLRLELIDNGEAVAGVLSMRGYHKNTPFGCDYIVISKEENRTLILEQIKIVRSLQAINQDCVQMKQIIISVDKTGADSSVNGFIEWGSGVRDKLTLKKIDTLISASAEDDINDYLEAKSDFFESINFYVKPFERFNKKVYEEEVDSSDVLLEFTSVDTVNVNDSISVYFNDQLISEAYLLTKPLLIRLTDLIEKVNSVLVVNESLSKQILKVKVKISYGNKLEFRTIEPSFSRNNLFLFRKQ